MFTKLHALTTATARRRPCLQASKLTSLVGLHASYLNDVMAKHQDGTLQDLTLFFSESWAQALFHDSFGGLRAQLHTALKNSAAAGAGTQDLEEQARGLVLGFIKAHIGQLPNFKLPG